MLTPGISDVWQAKDLGKGTVLWDSNPEANESRAFYCVTSERTDMLDDIVSKLRRAGETR